jgi:hypothetical protein
LARPNHPSSEMRCSGEEAALAPPGSECVKAIREQFERKTLWEGVVHVYALEGHPTASRRIPRYPAVIGCVILNTKRLAEKANPREPDRQISRIRLSDKTSRSSPTARRAQAGTGVRARSAGRHGTKSTIKTAVSSLGPSRGLDLVGGSA